eukprot:scaffold33284_cov79-Cyclotella_meneghiniana.AAC.2
MRFSRCCVLHGETKAALLETILVTTSSMHVRFRLQECTLSDVPSASGCNHTQYVGVESGRAAVEFSPSVSVTQKSAHGDHCDQGFPICTLPHLSIYS